MSQELNKFQLSLLSLVKSELGKLELSIVGERVEGLKESFITGEVESSDLRIWIYTDSAEFTDLNQIDCRYESVDYDSMLLMKERYVFDLIQTIKDSQ